MKKLIAYSIAMVLIASVSGCKYEEGPAISLRSKTARVANIWRVQTVLKNGEDVTSSYDNYKEIYNKDGGFSYEYSFGSVSFTGSGKWEFQNKSEQIRRFDVSAQDDRVLYITKLKENEFWYYYYDGSDKYELRLRE